MQSNAMSSCSNQLSVAIIWGHAIQGHAIQGHAQSLVLCALYVVQGLGNAWHGSYSRRRMSFIRLL